jgi:plasmid stability protein
MSAILVRNLPTTVHEALRKLAADRRTSIEALARDALTDLVSRSRPGGIDFAKLERERAALGISDDGPEWTDAMDDPALSRQVLGLPDA